MIGVFFAIFTTIFYPRRWYCPGGALIKGGTIANGEKETFL
jgi:hypothetical protein